MNLEFGLPYSLSELMSLCRTLSPWFCGGWWWWDLWWYSEGWWYSWPRINPRCRRNSRGQYLENILETTQRTVEWPHLSSSQSQSRWHKCSDKKLNFSNLFICKYFQIAVSRRCQHHNYSWEVLRLQLWAETRYNGGPSLALLSCPPRWSRLSWFVSSSALSPSPAPSLQRTPRPVRWPTGAW